MTVPEDFGPVTDGHYLLEQNTKYVLLNTIQISDAIRIPTGWIGAITSSNLRIINLVYTGSFSAIDTDTTLGGALGITIENSTISPNTKIKIIPGAGHTLSNGDLVNITGTTNLDYSAQRLIVSNVDGTDSFDVSISYVADDIGRMDLDAVFVTITNLSLIVNNTNSNGLLINFTPDPTALFFMDQVFIQNARGGVAVSFVASLSITNSLITFHHRGLHLTNCVDASIDTNKIINIDPSVSGANCIRIIDDDTRSVVINNTKLSLSDSSQFPIHIADDVTQADINISNSPDNEVADDYFDPAGLDQTNKQIITFNNGVRQNSEDLAEVRSFVELLVPTANGTPIRIEQSPPAANDFILDSTSEGFTFNDATGVATYDGRAPKRVRIEYSLEAMKNSGGTEDLDIELHVGGIAQGKTKRTINSGSSFITVSYSGGFFMVNPGDDIELFKDDTGSDHNIKNVVILIR